MFSPGHGSVVAPSPTDSRPAPRPSDSPPAPRPSDSRPAPRPSDSPPAPRPRDSPPVYSQTARRPAAQTVMLFCLRAGFRLVPRRRPGPDEGAAAEAPEPRTRESRLLVTGGASERRWRTANGAGVLTANGLRTANGAGAAVRRTALALPERAGASADRAEHSDGLQKAAALPRPPHPPRTAPRAAGSGGERLSRGGERCAESCESSAASGPRVWNHLQYSSPIRSEFIRAGRRRI